MPLVSVLATGGTIASRSDGGGAATARDAGAVPSGLLRPSQARMLLAALLGIDADPGAVRAAFADRATG